MNEHVYNAHDIPCTHTHIISSTSDADIRLLCACLPKHVCHHGAGLLRLVSPDGRFLDPLQSLQDTGLQDGESLCAVAQPETTLQVAATERAFAVWSPGFDRIVTWGHPHFGGDSSSVQSTLRNVQQVQRMVHSPQSLQMALWFHGGCQTSVVTASL